MFSWVRLSHLAAWTGGSLTGSSSDFPVRQISTDSRSLKPGDVFLPLRGENFDGHDYLETAVKAGAVAVFSDKEISLPVPVVRVADTLTALTEVGRQLRRHFTGKCFAITGSAGKSSTKEMLATLLGPRTVCSPASFNNMMGVSRTTFLIEDETRHLVLEMGMNAFGELRDLCQVFQPHGGLITNIGDAHMGRLGGREGVYRAKKELFDHLASLGTDLLGVAVNRDDAGVERAYQECFGAKPGVPCRGYSARGASAAEVRVEGVRVDPDSAHLNIRFRIGSRSGEADLAMFGTHHAQNAAAAMAAATLMGVSFGDIEARLKTLRPASHRGEIHRLALGAVLIDESYNSNPSALRSSLESVFSFAPSRRRVLVLGDMREMGDYSEEVHRQAGEHVVSLLRTHGSQVRLFGVGTWVRTLLEVVRAAEPSVEQTLGEGPEAIWESLRQAIQPEDVVLIKGSRGNRLDLLVDRLLDS